MRYVDPPSGRKQAENSRWLMNHIVYMPIHSGVDDKDFRETIDRSIECYHKLCDFLNQDGTPKPTDPKTKQLLERAKL